MTRKNWKLIATICCAVAMGISAFFEAWLIVTIVFCAWATTMAVIEAL